MKKELRSDFLTRQYMVSKDFEIYYYSDKNLKGVDYHSHNYYEFYFFLGGSVSLEIDGVSSPLSPGDMVLIPPGVRHRPVITRSDESYQRFVFWISQDYCTRLLPQSRHYGYVMQQVATSHKYIYHFDVFTFNGLQTKIFSLIEELQSDRFGAETRIGICVEDLVFSINRYVYEMENPSLPKEEHSLCQNLLSYMEANIAEDISLELLSREFYVSKYHIAHVFKDNLGLSVHQYIIKKRLALSSAAILSHTEISQAYLQFGFKDYSAFYRAFKKEYGMSPKEYREVFGPLKNGGA